MAVFINEEGGMESVTPSLISEIKRIDPGIVTEGEMLEELGGLYGLSLSDEVNGLESLTNTKSNLKIEKANLRRIGGWILDRIRKFLCENGKANGTLEEIIAAVIEALISIIPGGKIIKLVVRKIAEYIAGLGGAEFCKPVVE